MTLAVLVSSWAHVLHAMYKPWGAGTTLYSLQHASLFVTSFVFLMGLLFKVDGVSASSDAYAALAVVMTVLCALFLACWVVAIAYSLALNIRAWREAKQPTDSPVAGPRAPSPVTGHSGARGLRPLPPDSVTQPCDFVIVNPLVGQLNRAPTDQ